MLILAGVSLNALVGDNGIITNAQNATMKNSMAMLEEFLQQKYVENFENFTSEDKNKVAKLAALYQDYFYNPQTDGYGTVNYVLDSEGHALYLINKSGLPQEIRENLNAGNCGIGKNGTERYIDYVSLLDVYGVTGDLKAYYSSGDGTFMGIASSDELDMDTTSRPVLEASNALASLIKSDGTALTVADVQSVKNLTIDSTSGITSLSDLYALGSLENLTLEGVTLKNLDGIQTAAKLNYIYIKSCIIDDEDNTTYKEYAALKNVSKLTYLYFYDINDTDLTKICNGIKDATYQNLQYLAFVGNETYISSTNVTQYANSFSDNTLTNLEPLSMLRSSCVKNVQYLSLQNNRIENTTYIENGETKTKYALENLKNFSNLYLLRIEKNQLTTLKGLEDKSELYYLDAQFNKLGDDESYSNLITVIDEKTGKERVATDYDNGKNDNNALYALQFTSKLYGLSLRGNVNLKWISYIVEDSDIRQLYFGDGTDTANDCINMIDTEVASIRGVLKKCGNAKTCPTKYWLSLLDTDDDELFVDLANQIITKAQFESLATYANIKYLNLYYLKVVKSENDSTLIESMEDVNTLFNSTLKNISNLEYLCAASTTTTSFHNLTDITFIKGIDTDDTSDDINLKELVLNGTLVSTKKEKDDLFQYYNEGLLLLKEKRNESLGYYCPDLMVLGISEEHIDLSDIEVRAKTILSKITFSYFYQGYFRSLYIDNIDILKTLTKCTSLTTIQLNSNDDTNTVLDLSGLTQLEYFYWAPRNGGVQGHIKLPSSVTGCEIGLGTTGTVDFSDMTNFSYRIIGSGRESVISALSTVKSTATITNFNTTVATMVSNTDKNFNIFKEVYDLTGYKLKIQNIIGGTYAAREAGLASLDGIEYITGLQTLNLSKDKSAYLADISKLSSQKDTLEALIVPNSSISNISVLELCTSLVNLDLTNNCLSTYVEIKGIDENNQEVITRWVTLNEICNRMKQNAIIDEDGNVTKKVTLKLAGNSSITDWSSYTDNAKYWSSSSTYGST